MSHRELPRSGRGCFSAVLLLPPAAVGGVLALVLAYGPAGDEPVEHGRAEVTVGATPVSIRTTEDAPGFHPEPPQPGRTAEFDDRKGVQKGQPPGSSSPDAPESAPPPGAGPSPTSRSAPTYAKPSSTPPTTGSDTGEPTASTRPTSGQPTVPTTVPITGQPTSAPPAATTPPPPEPTSPTSPQATAAPTPTTTA